MSGNKGFRVPASFACCRGHLLFGNGEEDSLYRRAFSRGDLLSCRFYAPRQLGAYCAHLLMRADASGALTTIPMRWSGLHLQYDVWSCELDTAALDAGLYFLAPSVTGAAGELIGVREEGVTCRFEQGEGDCTYQLTLSDFAYPAPTFMEGGILYQIFVDRFFRGAETPIREDAVYLSDWEGGTPEYPVYPGAPLKNNTFFGGNLQGVTAKLDYLVSLGVTALYLNPIFEAYSNHKYDTGDYAKIDEMFGGEDAFRTLIAEAKRRGIRLILDGVFNHTGDDSVYFNRYGRYPSLGAYQSTESPYYAWYDFQSYPDRYTAWWGIPILPRIHTEVPACRDYFLRPGGIIDRYASMGVDGFRLDVVDELPDVFVDGIKARLSETRTENVLYGEVWEDASNKIAYGRRRRYYAGRQLDGVMNYELRRGILHFLRYHDPAPLRYALTEVMPNTPKRILDCQMNLIGTHDTVRVLTALGGDEAEGHTNDELAHMRLSDAQRRVSTARLRLAYTILATLPGLPMIYYGDEVGMEGYADPFNRRPFPWHAMDESLLAFYRRIGAIRHAYGVYRHGGFRLLHLDAATLAFAREEGNERSLTLVNASDVQKTWILDGAWKIILGDGESAVGAYVMPPCTAAILVQI